MAEDSDLDEAVRKLRESDPEFDKGYRRMDRLIETGVEFSPDDVAALVEDAAKSDAE